MRRGLGIFGFQDKAKNNDDAVEGVVLDAARRADAERAARRGEKDRGTQS